MNQDTKKKKILEFLFQGLQSHPSQRSNRGLEGRQENDPVKRRRGAKERLRRGGEGSKGSIERVWKSGEGKERKGTGEGGGGGGGRANPSIAGWCVLGGKRDFYGVIIAILVVWEVLKYLASIGFCFIFICLFYFIGF